MADGSTSIPPLPQQAARLRGRDTVKVPEFLTRSAANKNENALTKAIKALGESFADRHKTLAALQGLYLDLPENLRNESLIFNKPITAITSQALTDEFNRIAQSDYIQSGSPTPDGFSVLCEELAESIEQEKSLANKVRREVKNLNKPIEEERAFIKTLLGTEEQHGAIFEEIHGRITQEMEAELAGHPDVVDAREKAAAASATEPPIAKHHHEAEPMPRAHKLLGFMEEGEGFTKLTSRGKIAAGVAGAAAVGGAALYAMSGKDGAEPHSAERFNTQTKRPTDSWVDNEKIRDAASSDIGHSL